MFSIIEKFVGCFEYLLAIDDPATNPQQTLTKKEAFLNESLNPHERARVTGRAHIRKENHETNELSMP